MNMSTGAKAAIGTLIILVVLGVFGVASVIGTYNSCVNQEEGLEAQYKQNQNNYDNMYKRLTEAVGVSERYASDFKKVYDSVMEDRYGADGSQAIFQMISESNPQLDGSVYKQIQQMVESSRESFMNDQKSLLDKKRVYQAYLQQIPSGIVAKMMGFPRKDISKFDIVSSDRTIKTFENKKDEPLNLGPKSE